jgi:hypothetical protein
MFNLSCHYTCEQQTSLPELAVSAPDADFFLEMTQTTMRLKRDGIEEFRMTTPEQSATTASVAAAQGAAGVSLFNFPYYRRNTERGDAVYTEPPFEVIREMKEAMARPDANQHYFFGPGSNVWRIDGFALPRQLSKDRAETFTMEMVAPPGGWTQQGRLRIQLDQPADDRHFEAVFNGRALSETQDVSEPFANPYTRSGGLGRPGELRAWTVPAESMRVGRNSFALTLTDDSPVKMVYVDLGIRGARE